MATQILKPSLSQRNLKPYIQHKTCDSFDQTQKLTKLLQRNFQNRSLAIHWMSRACSKYKFNKDTLFLAIKIMDQLIHQRFNFLEVDYQLVAACLILLSTKYNEVYPVSIDQLNLLTEKYYAREEFWNLEGLILECIDFEIPETTLYSELYNEFFEQKLQIYNTDSDKENDANCANVCQSQMQKKASKEAERQFVLKLLKIVKEPETFKYGEQILIKAFGGYFYNRKQNGISVVVVKTNYIKTVLKKIFEGEKKTDVRRAFGLDSANHCFSPRSPVTKQNPQIRFQRSRKMI